MLLCCSLISKPSMLLSAFAGSAGLAGRVLAGRGAADCAAVFSAAGEFGLDACLAAAAASGCALPPTNAERVALPGAGMACASAIACLSCASAAAVIS